jgi:hypothetical protein
VNLFYGDADYICLSPLVPTSLDPFSNKFTGNWFGGQAISLQVNYTHAEQFAAAGYEPFVVDGTEYGEVRQYGNCKLPNTAIRSVPIENKSSHTPSQSASSASTKPATKSPSTSPRPRSPCFSVFSNISISALGLRRSPRSMRRSLMWRCRHLLLCLRARVVLCMDLASGLKLARNGGQ